MATKAPTPAEHDEVPPPTGTLFVLALFLAALAGIWGAMYLLLLGR